MQCSNIMLNCCCFACSQSQEIWRPGFGWPIWTGGLLRMKAWVGRETDLSGEKRADVKRFQDIDEIYLALKYLQSCISFKIYNTIWYIFFSTKVILLSDLFPFNKT